MREPDIVEVGGEILDCPFCGNPGVIYLSGCDGKGADGKPKLIYSVHCAACGMGNTGDGLTYEDALRLWNRRIGG